MTKAGPDSRNLLQDLGLDGWYGKAPNPGGYPRCYRYTQELFKDNICKKSATTAAVSKSSASPGKPNGKPLGDRAWERRQDRGWDRGWERRQDRGWDRGWERRQDRGWDRGWERRSGIAPGSAARGSRLGAPPSWRHLH